MDPYRRCVIPTDKGPLQTIWAPTDNRQGAPIDALHFLHTDKGPLQKVAPTDKWPLQTREPTDNGPLHIKGPYPIDKRPIQARRPHRQ